ncbi:hypothetical protein SNL152K_10759 [Streptomyces sp. NL15-2K]|nr:hypothetical protein SNL152K_10759 [Streptomyces sp. NL15-2K]
MPRQRPLRSQLLHQPVERHVLVSEGTQVRLPHPPQHSPELRITRQIRADHQRIDEEPDEIVQGLVDTAGHTRPDGHIGARTHPRQRHRQRRLHHHEDRHALGTSQLHQPLMHLGGHLHRHPMPGVTRHGRPRPVRRQRQLLRRTGQRPPPVLHLRRQQTPRVGLLPQQLPLPQRIIRVLHRQRLPHRSLTPHPCRIRHRQIPAQRPHRPAVASDVMHHQYERRLLVQPGLEQPRPDRQLGRQIELIPPRPCHGIGEFAGLDPADLQFPVQFGHIEDVLVRLTVHGREHRPQRLMPGDDVTQRRIQRGDVHRAAQPDRRRQVVEPAGPLQLRQEPQPPLRERQGHPLGTHPRPQRRTSLARAVRDTGRQPGRRRSLEERTDRNLDTQHRTDTRHQSHREQRVPAELEEAVVHAHRLQPQYVGERRAQDLLLHRGRSAAPVLPRGVLRRRQRPPVQLAVDRQREFRQGDHHGRNHVFRQPLRHQPPQVLEVHEVVVIIVIDGGEYDVGNQPLVTRTVLADHHSGPRHTRVHRQHCLDLTGLDTEAPHLHLLVRPPDEHQLPTLGPLHQVPGPVHPLTGPERARHEPLTRQPRTPDIPARHPGTGHIQFADHAHRHRLKPLIQHVRTRVGDRRTDRRLVTSLQRRRHRRTHRDLRRTIRIDQPTTRGPTLHQPRVQRLTRRHQRGDRIQRGITQGAQHRRRQRRMRHPTRRHQLDQPTTRQHLVRRRHHQRRTRAQRHQNFRHRRVKTDRRELQHPRTRLHRKPLTLSSHQIRNPGVRHRHTLRHTRRPGRIDHIRQPRPVDRHFRRGSDLSVQQRGRRRIVQGHQRHPAHRQVVQGVLAPQNELRAAAGQHERHPIHGQSAVDRQESRPGLQHTQNSSHQVGAPRQAQPHHRLTPHTHAPQIVREPIRLGLQLPVHEAHFTVNHRDRIRSRIHPPPEQIHHRRTGHHTHGRVIPPMDQQLSLLRAEHVHRAQPHIRLRRHQFQHPRDPGRESGGGRLVEQVRRDVHRAAQPRRPALAVEPFAHHHVDVALDRRRGGRVRGRYLLGPDTGHVEPGTLDVLQCQSHLEERVPRRRPGRCQLLHQTLERHILVRQRPQARLAHPPQHGTELRVTGQVRPDHQAVDEEPDQVVQRLVGATGHAGPDGDIGARPHPGQRYRQGRLHHHERRHALGARQLHEPLMHLGGHP